jgi:hypothetical protein
MIGIVQEIDAARREVGGGRIAAGEGRSIRLRRTYDAPIDDVWDWLTNLDLARAAEVSSGARA